MLDEERLRSDLGFLVDCPDKTLVLARMLGTLLLDGLDKDELQRITDVMTHAAATPRGTYEGNTQILRERAWDARDPKIPFEEPKVPSWLTYRRALQDFGQPPIENIKNEKEEDE
ncbi:MAG: hypothetical protein ACYC2H_01975 [Thermoplasmatota archaeon]